MIFVPPTDTRAEQLPVKTYTTADGLARDVVSDILQDSRGYLWFATGDGLSRFDGYEFKTYGVAEGLSYPFINDLLETRDGTLWLATNGGGVCRFNPSAAAQESAQTVQTDDHGNINKERQNQRLIPYKVENDLVTNRVNRLYEDSAGRLWAGTDDGLFRLEDDGGQKVFRRVEIDFGAAAKTAVYTFLEDREGSLWIGASSGRKNQRQKFGGNEKSNRRSG